MTGRAVLHVRFLGHRPADHPELVRLLHDLTPVVRAVPPDTALADVRGALRYFGADAERLAGLLRVRTLALRGVDCAVGVAGNPLLARLAVLDRAGPGVWVVPDDPAGIADFLAEVPVGALPGVGAATARTLAGYGLDTVGRLAAAPPATLQRVLGAGPARQLHALARGEDPTPIVPGAPEPSLAVEHRFDRGELDAGWRRRALLGLAVDIGRHLRAAGQVARAITLTVRYADRSTTTRTRTLPEPTAHTPALAGSARALHDALGLQRARVAALALRVDGLRPAERASQQLTFDRRTESARRLEPVIDRIAARWPGSVVPATLARPGGRGGGVAGM
ncbi:hypothetical protein RM844_26445 [Streptomyces sp. DSM 44915]|uniref:UmuC domain-containing protein n=1 Tax=Streptomyces chisholmiae TaxID=3075540 RepID=A0ABU2K041_9ACTN|nr:hypothetical protein [Streptomyces sp. DSM 44915]MDT0269828.1 hypothetical protein [Streptomyces sp. DSM 44915]